jgi:hypothetical protein
LGGIFGAAAAGFAEGGAASVAAGEEVGGGLGDGVEGGAGGTAFAESPRIAFLMADLSLFLIPNRDMAAWYRMHRALHPGRRG